MFSFFFFWTSQIFQKVSASTFYIQLLCWRTTWKSTSKIFFLFFFLLNLAHSNQNIKQCGAFYSNNKFSNNTLAFLYGEVLNLNKNTFLEIWQIKINPQTWIATKFQHFTIKKMGGGCRPRRDRDLSIWSKGQWEVLQRITWGGDRQVDIYINWHCNSMKDSARGPILWKYFI